MIGRILLMAGLMMVCLPLHADDSGKRNAIEDIVERRFAGFKPDEPGALVAVMRENEEFFRYSSGLARLEDMRPLTARTQMRIASLAKQFVAVAIMQEVERGTIDLAAPVTRYLPELAPAGAGVTVRHLLHHTSGLQHHSLIFMNEGLVPYDPGPPAGFLFAPEGSRKGDYMPTNEEVIELLAKHPEPRFAPGTQWEYSNAGYIVLVQIMEAIHGKPFREISEERLFAPLGMKATGVLDEMRPKLSNRANSYLVMEDGFEERDYSPFNLLHGDGGLFSSLEDLMLWRRAYEPGVLLTAERLDALLTRGRLDNGTAIEGTPRGTGYAMGWFTDTYGDTPVLLHGGGWLNFRHTIHFAPAQGWWVIVLTNRSDTHPYETAEEIMRVALQ